MAKGEAKVEAEGNAKWEAKRGGQRGGQGGAKGRPKGRPKRGPQGKPKGEAKAGKLSHPLVYHVVTQQVTYVTNKAKRGQGPLTPLYSRLQPAALMPLVRPMRVAATRHREVTCSLMCLDDVEMERLDEENGVIHSTPPISETAVVSGTPVISLGSTINPCEGF